MMKPSSEHRQNLYDLLRQMLHLIIETPATFATFVCRHPQRCYRSSFQVAFQIISRKACLLCKCRHISPPFVPYKIFIYKKS